MSELKKTFRPQDDFFHYINSDWLASNPIPSNESTWGTFYVLRDKSWNALNEIIADLTAKNSNDLSNDQKLLKTFFESALSYSEHRENHIKTLNIELQKITELSNISQLSYYLGEAHRNGFGQFWSNYAVTDDKNSKMNVLMLYQGGLSLPNRDYYLDDTPKMKKVRDKYATYFDAITNELNNTKISRSIAFNIEHALAKGSWTDIKLRDIEKNYTRFTMTELCNRFPRFDWKEYYKGINWKNPSDNIVVGQPLFIDCALDIINSNSLDDIKTYLSWQVIDTFANWIDEKTSNISFDFYEKIINGKTTNHPLWKRAVLQADRLTIGETLGREYCLKHFPESSKEYVSKIVEDVRAAYHKRIDNVTWMKESTKAIAHKKLDNTKLLIGYPSKWRDLSNLDFCSDNIIQNLINANANESDFEMAKIGNEPDPEEWCMNAHTVNACYDPNQLVICFPAAILQAPFFHPKASYATNLGGIGTVIGHEFTHGFDDQGAKFDEYGNTNDWQTKTERAAFTKMTKTIIEQANNFEVLPKLFLKGKLVVGEAIADIGGVELAIESLKANTDVADIDESIKDLLENFAKAECGSQREEHLIRMVKTDPHPPSIFRVNCVVNHIDDFYRVYGVGPNDKMYLKPEDRSKIW